MKNKLIYFLIALAMACNARQAKLRTGLEGQTLPATDLLLEDSATHFYTSDATLYRKLVLICFSPYCPYCRAEVNDILSNMSLFRDTDFYLVTPYPISDMKQFSIKYKLNRYKNILVGQDYKNSLLSYYGAKEIPYTAIYDANKRLKEVIIGNIEAKIIRKILME